MARPRKPRRRNRKPPPPPASPRRLPSPPARRGARADLAAGEDLRAVEVVFGFCGAAFLAAPFLLAVLVVMVGLLAHRCAGRPSMTRAAVLRTSDDAAPGCEPGSARAEAPWG